MRVLVVGSGGREHAIIWKLAQSSKVSKIYAAPGNGGTGKLAENVDIEANDLGGLLQFALDERIDLTIVGPEDPLIEGVADLFKVNGLRCFGPRRDAARLEGSKAFAKDMMTKANVKTAPYKAFITSSEAIEWLNTEPEDKPQVVKADGPAKGKGVLICKNRAEAIDAVRRIITESEFGRAGDKIVIEECLNGTEVSLLAICSGKDALLLAPSQDYKRIGNGDSGPNTGGMGNYSPVPHFDKDLIDYTMTNVIAPILELVNFVGVLFVGLMVTENGPEVLEFNVRFGDPETQVVLPRLKTDLIDVLMAAVDGNLKDIDLKWHDDCAVTVVMAAGGYPDKYESGKEIIGVDVAETIDGVTVFHAGTKIKEGKLLTAGGRLLNVTAVAPTFDEAIEKSYEAVGKIKYEDAYYRTDIGEIVKSK